MSWALISDSSCNLRAWQPSAPDTIYRFAPLKIRVGEQEYIDDLSLDVDAFNQVIFNEPAASSTSCSSVGEWAELFRLADKTICMPISEIVSGSFNAAATARDIVLAEEPHRQIHLVNSRGAGAKLDLIFILFDRYLKNNPDVSFDDACAFFEQLEQHTKLLFNLCSYENLAKSGRMPKVAGLIANKLNIRLLGTATEVGEIKVIGPARGEKKMFKKILDTMEEAGFTGGDFVIDHVNNVKGAEALAEHIINRWPDSNPIYLPCTGLCSYYAELNGIIVGFGWGPAGK